ncbi:MAG: 1-deoxy-D-xylulose-5-phosphate reductoisomerase [Lentisphaerae bacterium]|nr:1-deoxy-D-xylulose-5-phosphate reductoisomerase [Lentisphaerota bacterium]
MKKKVVVLGSSGSIGKNTMRVLETLSDRFEVTGLAVKNSVELLAEQAVKFKCRNLVVADAAAQQQLESLLPEDFTCRCGVQALVDMVTQEDVDIVVCAIVGTGGLLPVLAALQANKRVALASKEVMVMAGDLVNAILSGGHGEIIPVDSEHSAIFQCLKGGSHPEVSKIILTASGGAFRDWSCEKMAAASWQDALAHPVWSMGSKVTIDSATLMNKALEIVEASRLFQVRNEQLEVVIHPQSLIHSMVEFSDGAIMAQLSQPDMRFAIQYAMTYPERCEGNLERLDWRKIGQLTFLPPDRKKYPSLDIAFAALAAGGTMPAVMNAANEVAVQAFCNEAITLPQIWRCVEQVMDKHNAVKLDSLETALAADREARIAAEEFIRQNKI